MREEVVQQGEERDGYSNSFAYFMAFFAVICAISMLPVAIVAWRTFSTVPGFAGALLLFSIPAVILLGVGSIGLFKKRPYGFFVLYLVIFFGQFGGFKKPLFPFVERFVHIGFRTPDLFLLINLVLGAILLRDHLYYLQPGPTQRRKIYALWAAGIAFVVAGQFIEVKQRGTVQTVQNLPLVGATLEPLATKGSIEYQQIYNRLGGGLMQVASGNADAEAIQSFAEKHRLKELTVEQAKKLMPLAKKWKLDAAKFPTQFGTNDLAYTGRLQEKPVLTLQLGFDRDTGRFALQTFGGTGE